MPQRGLDTSLLSAAGLFLARSVGAISGSLTTLILARFMPLDSLGQIVAWIALANLLSVAMSLNLESGAVRFVLPGSVGQKVGSAFLSTASLTVFAVGALLGLVMYGVTADESLLLAMLAGCLVAFLRLRAKIGVARGILLASVLPRLALAPILFLGLVCLLALTVPTLTVPAVMGAFVIAYGAALFVQVSWARLSLRLIWPLGPETAMRQSWFVTAASLSPFLLVQEYLRDILIVVAALTLNDAEIGLLAIAFAIASIPGFCLIALDMASQPSLAAAIRRSDRQAFAAMAHRLAWARIGGAGSLALMLLMSSDLLSKIFSVDPVQLQSCLAVMVLVPIIRAGFGNTQLPLTIMKTGLSVAMGPGVSVCLMILLVPAGGVLAGTGGAGIGLAVAVLTGQVVQYALCRTGTGYDPSLWAAVSELPALRKRHSAAP